MRMPWPSRRAGTARFVREERATTMVEASLVIGMLLVLLFGAIDWSRYHYNRGRLRSAVRRGALYGARQPSGTMDSAAVAAYTRAALVGTTAEQALGVVDVEQVGADGDDLRVQVTWMDFPLTRATSLVMRSARSDTVRAEFRVEQP